MNDNSVITCYWNSGGFYFETEPMIRYGTEAAMLRKADAMGFTHVVVRHGYYKTGEGFIVQDVTPRKQRIPKKYRKNG